MALPSSLYDSLIVIAISIAIFVVGILIGKALGWATRNLLEKVGIND
ncbi:MAG: mechanosensitive ion channel family protein [Fervidicoccaceae archaeon]